MNHKKILLRAWSLLWQSRVLWLFGFLFVLAGGSGMNFPGGNGGGSSGRGSGNQPHTPGGPTPPFPDVHFGDVNWTLVAGIIVGVVILVLLLALAAVIIRYLAETALVAGVDEIESTGAQLTVRRGFRLGWSREAGRLFLLDLVVYVPLALVAVGLLAAAALPLLFWLTQMVPLGIIASIITVCLEFLVICALIAAALVLSVTMPYIRRQVVLGKLGVFAALRQGFQLVRASLVDTGLMWLLLTGLRIVWSLVMIPVFIVLVILAVLVGAVPAGVAYLLSHSWVWPVVVGAPLFLLALVLPATFAVGLFESYTSASWTLAYREAADKYAEPPLPQPA